MQMNQPGLRRLTPRQLAAINLLFAGMRFSEVANRLGVDRRTIHRWRHSEDFVAEIERQYRQQLQPTRSAPPPRKSPTTNRPVSRYEEMLAARNAIMERTTYTPPSMPELLAAVLREVEASEAQDDDLEKRSQKNVPSRPVLSRGVPK